LGYRLIGSKGLYRRWEDIKDKYWFFSKYPAKLDERYHPQAENISYHFENAPFGDGSAILLIFDTDIYYPSYTRGFHPSSWIILYDKEGRIRNILNNNITFCDYYNCLVPGRYHVYGFGGDYILSKMWVTPDVINQWWKPVIKLTTEDINIVDHIRVFNEIQDDDLCTQPLP
jgi:hypothetical protein